MTNEQLDKLPKSIRNEIGAYGAVSIDIALGKATESDLIVQGQRTLTEIAKAIEEAENRACLSVATSANKLRNECYAAAYNAGWWRVSDDAGGKMDVRCHSKEVLMWWIGTKIALMHSELSEALEGERRDKMDEHLPHLKSRDVEFADAIIRIMDLCGGLGIDIGRAITEKMAYNAQRADHKPENRDSVGGKAF